MRIPISKFRAITLALTSLLLIPSISAQQPITNNEHTVAFDRAATLTQGTNLSGWFGGWGDYSEQHTNTYITAADFQAMHAMGIRFVRFPFDPVLLMQGGLLAPNKEQLWKRIDAALDMAMNAGMSVDFVVFPRDDYKKQLDTQNGAERFIMLWQVLAKHFAGRDPDRFFFELMNESEQQDSFRWIGLQSSVIAAIRHIDTQHTILASGAHYDSLDDLLSTEPVDDSNVIYTFHFYEPYPFTHQGASWSSIEFNYYKDVPYPATTAQVADLMKTVPGDLARYNLYLYAAGGWNATTIDQRIAFAADWGREHHVPVLCNEFGAFRDTAPPDSRARYLHDVRSALEHNHIGWDVGLERQLRPGHPHGNRGGPRQDRFRRFRSQASLMPSMPSAGICDPPPNVSEGAEPNAIRGCYDIALKRTTLQT